MLTAEKLSAKRSKAARVAVRWAVNEPSPARWGASVVL